MFSPGISILSIVQNDLAIFFNTCREIGASTAENIKDLALARRADFFCAIWINCSAQSNCQKGL